MTNRIQHIIDEIRSKKNALSDLLKLEKEKVAKSEVKLRELEELLTLKGQENDQLVATTKQLENELKIAKEANAKLSNDVKVSATTPTSLPKVNDEVQIDELVREIEYCIGQLKNNA